MRDDIKIGATFPDYELPDHTDTPRKLSLLQGRLGSSIGISSSLQGVPG